MKRPERFFNKSNFRGIDLLWILVCGVIAGVGECRVTPRLSSFSTRSIFGEPTKPIPGPEKNYTGIRVREDSILIVYYHEQTVAVVEVAPNRLLFNCELLEVRTKADKQVALNILKPVVPTQIKIAFSDMTDLMHQCQKLDFPGNLDKKFINESSSRSHINPRQLTSIFSGVFPGTKWCGAGDIAGSYHDLGTDRGLDKCCRTHDLCPVKVAGLKTQYNLTNYSIYTKSHCVCDDYFYNCLKSLGTTTSNFLGNIYFNVAQVTCVEDVPPEDPVMKITQKRFTTKYKRY